MTSESVVQAIRSGALRSQTADDDDQMEQTAPAIPPIPVGGLPPISRSFPGNSLSEEEEASYSKSEPSSTFPFSTTRPLLNDILDEHSIQQETNDAFLSRINGIDEVLSLSSVCLSAYLSVWFVYPAVRPYIHPLIHLPILPFIQSSFPLF